MLSSVGASHTDLVRGGVAVPGAARCPRDLSSSPLIFPAWAGVDIAEVFTERFGMPFSADNDANLGALADYLWERDRAATAWSSSA